MLGLAPVKIGGIEKFLRLFVVAMDRAGWDTVLCFDGAVADEFRATVDFPFCSIESVPGQENLGFSAAGALWRVLRQYRPKRFLYAFHGVMRCFPWLARLSGCREISFYDHSSRPPDFVARPLALPKRLVGRLLTFPLRHIVSVAEFTRSTGRALGVAHCPNTVLANGVFLPNVSQQRGELFRERYGIATDAVVITQLCWMVPVKGVRTLLQAAVKVLATFPETRFLLVGEGPELQHYRDLATELKLNDRIVFTGLVNNPTQQGVFEATDIYCQPSLWQEACPLAVLEAMSFNLPVVASRVGGLPELVRDGSTGLLATTGDSDALAEHLLVLVNDPALRHQMGNAAFTSVQRDHRIEQTVSRYVDLVLHGPPVEGNSK